MPRGMEPCRGERRAAQIALRGLGDSRNSKLCYFCVQRLTLLRHETRRRNLINFDRLFFERRGARAFAERRGAATSS